MDHYLLSFLKDEVKLQPLEQVLQWQQMLCDFISYLLCHGMPLEELNPRPTFSVETKQARNASESLLAALSSCSLNTKVLSNINFYSPEAFGSLLANLQGQPLEFDSPLALGCLNHLTLDCCVLLVRDFYMANLRGTSLQEANLLGSLLTGADLKQTNLRRADLSSAILSGADISFANLEGANLVGARLERANLTGANLQDISWDEDTQWNEVQGLKNAMNVPSDLKEQLGLDD
jgi:hypothetical protein